MTPAVLSPPALKGGGSYSVPACGESEAGECARACGEFVADEAFADVARLIDNPVMKGYFRECDLYHLKGTARELTDNMLGSSRSPSASHALAAMRTLRQKTPKSVWAFAVLRTTIALAPVQPPSRETAAGEVQVTHARLFEVLQPDARIRRDGCGLQCRLVNFAFDSSAAYCC